MERAQWAWVRVGLLYKKPPQDNSYPRSLLLNEQKPHTSKMTNIIHDATTPQLQVIDGLFKAYRTRDMNNAGNFLSKDFTFRSFPKIASLPDQTKEEHLQMFGPMCEGLVKVDVSVQYQGAAVERMDIPAETHHP